MINFNPALLAPNFVVRDSSTPFPVAVDKVVAPANAQRVFILIGMGTAGSTIRPGGVAGAGFGWTNQTAGQIFQFSFSDVGAMVCAEWHYLPGGVGSSCYILEVLWNPPGD